MDPLNWKRALVLGVTGVALGFGSATLVEARDWHPLAAPLLCAAGAAFVALALRKCEVLNFLAEAAIFAYGTFVGLCFVRTGHNYLENYFPSMALTPTTLLHGINLVVLAVGVPYTFAMVLLVCLPAWALAQYLCERQLLHDDRFWDFVREQNRR